MNQSKLQETKSTIRFSARLFRPEATEKIGVGSWTLLTLPKSASAKLPSPDRAMVEGTINGFPFRAALEPNGNAGHWLRVNKALQDAAGADVGDTVSVEMTRVGEEPELRVPRDLRKALEAAPLARALWAQITPMARRDWILWISSAKQEETRERRIENACDMLASGKRRPCCMPGINWRTKDSDVTSDETWLALPNSKSRSSARSTK
ncbi:MAG: YdeI/OmpD-associated family protein [Planctomycetaceae bacterium]|nr:YdeI/OmpD-associated family protein [Planctomycetaceae bacterium]